LVQIQLEESQTLINITLFLKYKNKVFNKRVILIKV